MKLYNVEVVETLSRVVEQKAASYDEAEDIVSNRYSDGEFVLDYNDLEDTNYKPYPSQLLRNNFAFVVEFNKDKKEMCITNGKESKTYSCKSIDDLYHMLKDYIDKNVELEDVVPEKNIKNKDYER